MIFIEEEAEKNNLYKLLEKQGKICSFDKQTPSQIVTRLKGIFNGYKVNIDDVTLKYLIESCGTSMQELINESRKLIEYAGETPSFICFLAFSTACIFLISSLSL